MKQYENFLDTLKNTSGDDVSNMFTNIVSSIKTGSIMNEPNVLMALLLLAAAGGILTICFLAMLFKRNGGYSHEFASLATLEARMHTMEISVQEHKAALANMKALYKADVAFVKQELKSLEATLGDLHHYNLDVESTRIASNS